MDFNRHITSHIPVAIAHLNSQPKHKVISLIIPQIIIQLTPYARTSKTITNTATIPPSIILSFILLIYTPLFMHDIQMMALTAI